MNVRESHFCKTKSVSVCSTHIMYASMCVCVCVCVCVCDFFLFLAILGGSQDYDSWTRTEPTALAVKARNPNHQATRELPCVWFCLYGEQHGKMQSKLLLWATCRKVGWQGWCEGQREEGAIESPTQEKMRKNTHKKFTCNIIKCRHGCYIMCLWNGKGAS